ncbi:ketopantoate reductase family protein [Piscinibacter sakaiensis]|uniref:2-dehydropantoate 2-reductase n=1 Tax=Piscinibacter sakaiensis TaxID=1547922 RepID=A0A0K8NUJ9_PISS1|nr:2-dehydropantoate 2-reductase [Piscinibacter sakaiensis]GAP33944.1 2-dehydropantoate 2-reductase [Piscinibacter sakaiensis]
MKVCIVGAGAIGGFLGTRLAAAGVPVAALARGATLQALRHHGWRLDGADGPLRAPVAAAADDPAALGRHDLVIVAVKGPALAAVAPQVAALRADGGLVLPAMNGVPWWFCAGRPGFEAPLASVDPGGRIGAAIPLDSVLGAVVHASTTTPEPGLVAHRMGRGLIIGEPSGGRSARAEAVGALLREAGFELTVSDDVRQDVWYKLWGNMTMNPVSAITGATLDRVLADPLVRRFCSAAMDEAAAVGARIGCPIAQSAEDRHALTARLGPIRTSMLQDVDAGRPLELDALVAAVREIAGRVGVPTPNLDALHGLARLFGRVRGLVPEDAAAGPTAA